MVFRFCKAADISAQIDVICAVIRDSTFLNDYMSNRSINCTTYVIPEEINDH